MDSIVTVALHAAEFPFRKRFATNGWSIRSRDVLYLSLTDAAGRTGVGEAAPLESFWTESFSACLDELKLIAPLLLGLSPSVDPIEKIMALRIPPIISSTARFAVETAMLDLRARQFGMNIASLLGGDDAAQCFLVNAVIPTGTIEETVAAAIEAMQAGFTCLKLKVGDDSPDNDARRLKAVVDAVGKTVPIRLDANGAWDRDTALEALARFAPFTIEYIEQPIVAEDHEGLALLKTQSPVSIAADESIATLDDAARLLADDACDVFILKPMALGGLSACRAFTDAANARWKKVVFTSLLDSAVGRHAVAHLAASLPAVGHHHHGLGTGALFAADVYDDDVQSGVFHLPGGSGLGFEPDLSPFPLLSRITR